MNKNFSKRPFRVPSGEKGLTYLHDTGPGPQSCFVSGPRGLHFGHYTVLLNIEAQKGLQRRAFAPNYQHILQQKQKIIDN